MPNISVSLPQSDNFLSYELSPEFTIGDLKGLINADTGLNVESQMIMFDGRPLTDNSQTLEAVGLKDNDMLVCAEHQPRQARPAPTSGAGQPALGSQENERMEQYRQRLLEQVQANPQLREQLKAQDPQVESALTDPARFRAAVLEAQRRAEQEIEARNNDWSEEAQAKIYEEIRQENVNKEAAQIMEENPELFGRVTMLYINVIINGHPVKAFVDSGAQTTVMSPSCAEACNITHLIDKRWQGLARGVGTAKILGRVHRANMSIGDADELPCSFTVMEGKDVDLLLGLDMLKRYQCSIDLQRNCLTLASGTVSVPFLPESEIPNAFSEALADEPTVPGPGGTSIGTNSGTVKPPPGATTAASSTAASSSASASKNFSGTGKTLGSAPKQATPLAAPQQSTPAPSSGASTSAAPRPAAAASAASESEPEFPQSAIDLLQSIGATRQQAIDALRACDGNVDYAAGMLFELD